MGNFEWTNREEGMGTAQNEWVSGARKGHRMEGGAQHIHNGRPSSAHPSVHTLICLPHCPLPIPSIFVTISLHNNIFPISSFLLLKWFNQEQKMANIFANIFLILAICLSSKFCHSAIQLPFGIEQGDEQLHFDDGPLVRRDPPGQFTYFERPFNSIYISQNGAISMGVPFDPNVNELDLERKDIIAVFFAPSSGGRIFYRSADGTNLLAKEISAKVRRAFGANEFEATSVLLITWDVMANAKNDATNTFQLALATNQNQTYALMVYSTIKWTKVDEDGKWAQAGFFSADGRSEKLLNSGGPSIGDVIKATNFNELGMFIYRISGPHPIDPQHGQPRAPAVPGNEEYEYQQEQNEYEQEDQITECPPDPFRDNCPPNCNLVLDDNHCSLCICSSVVSENLAGSAYSTLSSNELSQSSGIRPPRLLPAPLRMPDLSCTPQQGRAQCHQHANCLQYRAGYCCECENGFIGNGVECIAADGPLRINGQFEAALNGKMVQKTDLFSYIQPQEGQQHTALAKIQSEIGWSLLLLDSLSNPFGWLFARGQQQNGFQLTGGNFTRIVNIHLGERYALVIRQEFGDRQFADHFTVNVFVSGTLPELQGPVHVSIPEFEETYRRERAGLIRAYSERYILLRGGRDGGGPEEEKKYRITSDQQIHFTECPFRESTSAGPTEMVVKFERLNANFNEAENVVRFASQSHILARGEGDKGGGGQFDGDAGERGQMQQQDACSSGRHFCTLPNMICVPIPMNPGYRCECRPGFRLIEDNSVEQRMICQQQHQEGGTGQLENIVLPAPTIQPAILQPGECTRHDQCHQWGECVFGPIPGYPGKCKCRGWYVGDGIRHCGPPEQSPSAIQQPPSQTPQRPPGTICRGDGECGDNAECKYSEQHGYYVCSCKSGWRGDGQDCLAEAGPSEDIDDGQPQREEEKESDDEPVGTLQQQPGEVPIARKHCTDSSDCHPLFGSCILSEQTNAHFCVCLPGYQGDGVEKCERSEECSPTDPSQGCVEPNQECQFQHSLQKFTCQCRNGFVKQPDGNCAFEFDKTSQCQQCGPNAQCIRGEGGQWNCICNAGFMGNGMECRREANCLDEPRMCSPNAQCLPDGQKAYLCVCNYGYAGDGRTCEPIVQKADETAESLLIGRGMAIIKRGMAAKSNEIGGKQLIVQPHQIVVDIEYDCQNERIYWSDISGHSIRSAFLNGTEIRQQFGDILRAPEGIAIDWRSRNIYYLDSIKNELGVLSANGKFQKSLLKEWLNNPRALVIDLEGRQLFYSDWSREGPKIGRIGLDGSGNRVFVSEDVHLPNGLVLLQQRRWLCWVDAGNQRLSCIGLDGTGRRVIYAPLEYAFGLTVDSKEERFYWTDWKDHKIHSVDVFGKGHIEFLPGAGGRGKLYGVLSLPVKCQPNLAPSECSQIEKGGCTHWCLPGATSGTVTCVCPENVPELDQC